MRTRNEKHRAGLRILTALVLFAGMAAACSSDDPVVENAETGTVDFYANGEDFIRLPFVSKDGWEIAFDHFFVNLFGPTAIQGEEESTSQTSSVQASLGGARILHAGHPHTGIAAGGVHAALVGDYLVDLHQTPLAPEDDRTRVGTVAHADGLGNLVYTGNYNTVNFNIKPVEITGGKYTGTCPAMDSGECEASAQAMQLYSLRMAGTATCVDDSFCVPGEVVGFDILLLPLLLGEDPEMCGMAWSSCTWVGEPENPGLVVKNGVGWVEMTFHSDHIFGNGEEPDPDLDDFAPGFAPFAAIAGAADCNPGEDRCIVANQAELRVAWDAAAGAEPELQYAYGMLIYSLGTIGHCGEGHCLH